MHVQLCLKMHECGPLYFVLFCFVYLFIYFYNVHCTLSIDIYDAVQWQS